MKRSKLLFVLLLCLSLLLMLAACGPHLPAGEVSFLASGFVGYDFARTIANGRAGAEVTLLSGGDIHSFDPTFGDMAALSSCDLFITVGGESDAAIDRLLTSLPEVPVFRMMEHLPLLEEETPVGAAPEEEDEEAAYDEHVWTSPQNAVMIVRALAEAMIGRDPAGRAIYEKNAAALIEALEALDAAFADFFAGLDNKTLIFGDRFPFRYFAEAYGLSCYAAFPGCSSAVEPGPRTLTFLLDTVKREGVRAVYHLEGEYHPVADRLADAAGVESVLLHACHTVTAKELAAGVSYLSLMRENLETLRRTMG